PEQLLDPIVAIFVMAWIIKGRYTDTADRARRSEPLSAAAEVQWDLLPPLACSTERVAVSGILEPAYEIGGDSFDYAFDTSRVDFTMVDAVGHGMSAVLMSAAAINSLRNSRRAKASIAAAYEDADRSIAMQFGNSYFVTGLIGTLDLQSGDLTWINAGHVLPMLVRNGTYAGLLLCKPSRPFGLGVRSSRWPRRLSSLATECCSTPTASPRLDPRTDPFSGRIDWPTCWSERRWRTCLSNRLFGILPTTS
ncbi:MAG TPA: PP2C family protein-serine/threonine phosphatase, partial [Ilumatobacteraceae bacterium]|nr:PP2C family protein-serine/threonine phosphatase [Ilumatobacteraceae bacterium]